MAGTGRSIWRLPGRSHESLNCLPESGRSLERLTNHAASDLLP
jgi:hypothetical protein